MNFHSNVFKGLRCICTIDSFVCWSTSPHPHKKTLYFQKRTWSGLKHAAWRLYTLIKHNRPRLPFINGSLFKWTLRSASLREGQRDGKDSLCLTAALTRDTSRWTRLMKNLLRSSTCKPCLFPCTYLKLSETVRKWI